ncbi:hypothetical protein EYF80_023807 [Liparis tanakae]|uniref:Uncharacterized protein n=1 Tax=Liparis tanakae TaxID=230148 RepID=A0A4Z2HLW8_9TELE|nr:hypothetical protein EYF80_023807 [Liparis tanakae]
MGCTIYAASPKALPADEAPGQDRYYQLPHYRHPHEPGQSTATQEARRALGTLVLRDADGGNPGNGSLFGRSAPRSISTNHRGGVEDERDARTELLDGDET